MSESQELLTSKRHFYEHYYYSVELLQQEYLAEVYLYGNDQWSAPHRAARISAIVKRYKTSQMLVYIFNLASKVELDLTPLTVKRLCNVLFNRTGSQDIIVDTFGQRGRTNKSGISTRAAINEIALQCTVAAHSHWVGTLTDIERAKNEYKIQIQKRRSKL